MRCRGRPTTAREGDRGAGALGARGQDSAGLDGVHTSTRYPGGLALRCARVKRYRPDKPAEEADAIDDLRALIATRA
jgi:hypothetical protein